MRTYAVLALCHMDLPVLRRLRPGSPLCVPPLPSVVPGRGGEAGLLSRLDANLVGMAILPLLPLASRRTAACACRALRAVVFTHLHSRELAVHATDATWENAAFVARLPARLAPFGAEARLLVARRAVATLPPAAAASAA